MPFQITTTEPRMNPRVTVTFAGLMVLRPGPNNICEVGLHRFNTSHEIRVTLIIRKPNRQPTLVSLLQGPLEAPFTISHLPDPDPLVGRFAVFAPTPDPFKRDVATEHEFDYRWAVNVADRHPGIDLNAGAQPLVTLKTGILYTPHRTIPDLHPVLERGRTPVAPPTEEIQLHRIASSLAAAITTPAGTSIRFAWRDFGSDQVLDLPRPKDPPNTTYTVAFTNEPPKINAEAHNEMTLYYRILDHSGFAVGSTQQFTLEYPAPNARTDEVPCLAVTKNP